MAHLFMRFSEGKKKAVTLSYDDGPSQDARLIEIMKANGLKGTFNLFSNRYPGQAETTEEKTEREKLTRIRKELYLDNGMEIAAHGLSHPFLDQLPVNVCTYEILQDRMYLEQDFETIVRGIAYPFATYNDSVVESLKTSGIVYGRTADGTGTFDLPKDWLRLPVTCRHRNPKLMEYAREFVEKKVTRDPIMFYLWGHSYEFDQDPNAGWDVIEHFAEYVGNREDIWYATNIQIHDYVSAYKQLIWSIDGKRVYNPTALTIWFEMGGQRILSVKSGESLVVNMR